MQIFSTAKMKGVSVTLTFDYRSGKGALMQRRKLMRTVCFECVVGAFRVGQHYRLRAVRDQLHAAGLQFVHTRNRSVFDHLQTQNDRHLRQRCQ